MMEEEKEQTTEEDSYETEQEKNFTCMICKKKNDFECSSCDGNSFNENNKESTLVNLSIESVHVGCKDHLAFKRYFDVCPGCFLGKVVPLLEKEFDIFPVEIKLSTTRP